MALNNLGYAIKQNQTKLILLTTLLTSPAVFPAPIIIDRFAHSIFFKLSRRFSFHLYFILLSIGIAKPTEKGRPC